MDNGNFIHIIITVVAIIGAGAVALVCDMLKTNNERLRQENLELQVRREEEQRRAELAIDQLKRLTPPMGDLSLPAPAPAALTAGSALPEAPNQVAVSRPALHHHGPAAALREVMAASGRTLDGQQPGATLDEARKLARDFLSAIAAKEGHEKMDGPIGAQAASPPAATRHAEQRSEGSSTTFHPVAVSAEPTALSSRQPRKNWDQLLKGGVKRTTIDVTPTPSTAKKGELIPFESLQNSQVQQEILQLRLPSGFHGMTEGMTELSRLLDMDKPLHGLVVSVGLNGVAATESPNPGIPAGTLRGAASECVRALLEPGEFACQSAIDQFLIVSAATPEISQRRLTEITEKLWDFQLRTDLVSTMILSWGSYEATGETLAAATNCAMQRMEENRRGRTASAQPGKGRRRAV